jgi:Tol biopolymer transport system component/class 3 adenylate cyclase
VRADRTKSLNESDQKTSTLEMAHVLFMDIVSYSLLPTDRQSQVIQQLQQIVRVLPDFEQLLRAGQMICLPAGDGMALAFFRDPTAPLRYARQISLAQKKGLPFKLRMGIHSGPIYRHADINASANIAGGGINFAQRIMDCADAGHILASKAAAEVLLQITQWQGAVHHLGEHEVKHGVRIEVFNIFAEEFGNPEVPSKLVSARRTIGDGSPFKRTPIHSSIKLLRAGHFAWTAAAICFLCLIALAFIHFREPKEDARVTKFSVLPPEEGTFKSTSLPAVSPDGRRLGFVATLDGKDQLWVRDLDSLAVLPLMGTEGADEPFWSPDSRTIAFFAGGKLKKIGVAGGLALTLCDAVEGRGGTWNKDDVIVFGTLGSIFRISAAGGSAAPLTELEASGETSHKFPWFLPDGHHFLYTAIEEGQEKTAVYVADLDSKDRKLIVTADSNTVYAPPGYLLFVRERTLMAQPFDVRKLQTTGDAMPIAEQVDSIASRSAQNQFSASQNGVLAYTSGGGGGNQQLTWFDRSGRVLGTLGAPGLVTGAKISPDDKAVAITSGDPQTKTSDIWLHDLMRGTASRFTFGPRGNAFPVWSPDGSRIAFASDRDGLAHTFQKAIAGAVGDEVPDEPLGEPPRSTRVDDWSRDGSYMIEELLNTGNVKRDIWVLPLFGDRKAFAYLHSEFNETNAKLSPNGQWLAYTSDESRRNEIYVQTFPTPGGKWQVSTNGGDSPIWSEDGKELYFIGADRKMMAVEVKAGTKFEADLPKPLFDVRLQAGIPVPRYDVSKDGRFLIPVPLDQSTTAMTVVFNWPAGLKK